MAQQREDEGPAADISRQRRQGERPDKVAPGQASVKHQIKDLDRSHHDMSRIRQGDKPGHENNHHDLGRTGDRKHPDHGGDQHPEIIALANISVGLFFITSSAMLTKA